MRCIAVVQYYCHLCPHRKRVSSRVCFLTCSSTYGIASMTRQRVNVVAMFRMQGTTSKSFRHCSLCGKSYCLVRAPAIEVDTNATWIQKPSGARAAGRSCKRPAHFHLILHHTDPQLPRNKGDVRDSTLTCNDCFYKLHERA